MSVCLWRVFGGQWAVGSGEAQVRRLVCWRPAVFVFGARGQMRPKHKAPAVGDNQSRPGQAKEAKFELRAPTMI